MSAPARTKRITVAGLAVLAAVSTTVLTAPAALAASPAPAAASTTGHERTQAALDAVVKAGAPGVLARAVDERGTWKGTAGLGDLKNRTPRGAEDTFRVGSITKTFVATVLLQLEAEGRLSLDDTVETWLPGLVHGNGHDGSRITLRQLLNHTSGIFNYTADAEMQDKLSRGFFEHRFDTVTPRELLRIALRNKADFEPGTGWKYSNTNFVLAGLVIEKATKRSYAKEIERRVLKPLKLSATYLPGTRVTLPDPHGRAYSKLTDDPSAKIHDVTELNPSWGGAAGEMISTTGDLNRFYRALFGGRVLPKAQLKEMLTTVGTGDELGGARYGLGVYATKLSCGVTVWGHGGGIHGSISEGLTTRDARHSLALNLNGDYAGDTASIIEAEFCGR